MTTASGGARRRDRRGSRTRASSRRASTPRSCSRHVLGTTRSELHADGGRRARGGELDQLERLLARRAATRAARLRARRVGLPPPHAARRRARPRAAARDGGRRRALPRAHRRARGAARARRGDGERRDRARDRRRAPGGAGHRDRRLRGRARGRAGERGADGPGGRARAARTLRRAPGRPVGPCRLQPAVCPRRRARRARSRRCATGSRAPRSSARARRRQSRTRRARVLGPGGSLVLETAGGRRRARSRTCCAASATPTSVVTQDLAGPEPRRGGRDPGEHGRGAVAAIRARRARRHPDRHRLRPCVHAGRRGARYARSPRSRAGRRRSRSRSSRRAWIGSLELVPELRDLGAAHSCPARSRSSSRTPRAGTVAHRRSRRTRSACACRSSPGPAGRCSTRVGVVAATSANRHGEPDPRRLDEVPEEILRAVAAVVDGGELPGTPSTVLDLTGRGAARPPRGRGAAAAEALARVDQSARAE